MLNDIDLATLSEDFITSGAYAEELDRQPKMIPACHHRAYIAWRFLQSRGHAAVRFACGVYESPNEFIHHSWLEIKVNDQRPVILELTTP